MVCKIGMSKAEKQSIMIVNELMDHRLSIGMIGNIPTPNPTPTPTGGKPTRALYFIGRINDKYIYLDPHYVQKSAKNSNIMKQISTYFCDDFLTYESMKIDTSLCLGFYLKNLEDLEEFH